jgi:hypothetical protein
MGTQQFEGMLIGDVPASVKTDGPATTLLRRKRGGKTQDHRQREDSPTQG